VMGGTAPLLHQAVGHPFAFVPVGALLHWLVVLVVSASCAALPMEASGFLWSCWFLTTVLPCAVHIGLHGPTVWISNTVTIDAAVPPSTASAFVRCARNLDAYEQKVSGCSVHEKGFCLWGWWWGLPWCKRFHMRETPNGGFKATIDDTGWEWLPSIFRFRGTGGFSVASLKEGGCRVSHYERYGWPIVFPFVWPLAVLCWREWHLRGMQVEMEVIRVQLELMERHSVQGAIGDYFVETKSAKYTAGSFLREKLGCTKSSRYSSRPEYELCAH